jgi:hypothetical protein
MTDQQTPPDWVLVEAAKRCGWGYVIATLQWTYRNETAFRALCDMIQKYEQPPVDRKLLCVREAEREYNYVFDETGFEASLRAIELWEKGFGK